MVADRGRVGLGAVVVFRVESMAVAISAAGLLLAVARGRRRW